MVRRLHLFALIASGLAAGCAFDLAHVKQIPVDPPQLAVSPPPSFVLEGDVPLVLPFGFRRVLRQGSKWMYVGTIPAGDTYKSADQVFTVEASNIHEAFIVVAGGKLVGFYLPVERAYSPASESVSLPLRAL